MTLIFNPWRAVVMTHDHTQAKDQVRGSGGSKIKVKTNGRTERRTDTTDCITVLAYAVSNETRKRVIATSPSAARRHKYQNMISNTSGYRSSTLSVPVMTSY